MLLGENISLAVKSLISNKMRALLTMLGIIIGIAAVIAILTVGNSLNRSVSETMQSIGANDVFLSVTERSSHETEEESKKSAIDGVKYGTLKNTSSMTDEDYITGEMVRKMCDEFEEEIYAVNIQQSIGTADLSVGEKTSTGRVRGVSLGYFVSNPVEILAGSMLSETDFEEGRHACLIDQQLVDDLFGGDAKAALGQTMETYVKKQQTVLSIVGVYEVKAANGMGGSSMMMMPSQNSSILMPIKGAMSIARSKDQYSYIQVSAATDAKPDELADKLKEFFAPYYRNNSHYRVAVITYEGLLEMLYSLLDTITTAISIIAAIALLVGGIGVMNIMLVSVTERTREIGTRKALGARNSSIRMQFLVEAMIICLIGGIIGVVLGIGLGMFAANLLGYPAVPSIPGIIIALLFSMSIGLFFGYVPANKAAKMNPIDALRYE